MRWIDWEYIDSKEVFDTIRENYKVSDLMALQQDLNEELTL